MKNFQHKVAVITGGAGGLGRAFSDKATALGMKLVLSDVRDEALQKMVAELRANGATVTALAGDVADPAHIEALAKLALDTYGNVHCLFNNAGVGTGGLLWENTVKDWEWTLNVNLWGVIHGVRVFTPLMLEAAKKNPDYEATIVNVSSVAGLISPPLLGIYNVSKHAVVALSETLYHDLAKTEARVRAAVLCPGFTPTGIHESFKHRPGDAQNATPPTASMLAAQAMTEKAVLSGKLTPADVAEATFAAIAENRFYIFTHPKFMPLVKARLEDMAEMRNPRDMFGMKA